MNSTQQDQERDIQWGQKLFPWQAVSQENNGRKVDNDGSFFLRLPGL